MRVVDLFMWFFLFILFFNFFHREPVYECMSNEIIKKFSAEVLKPKKLRICALGGSSDHGIKMIHLGVMDNGPGNVEEARKLIIDLTRELVCRYNSNSEIKPYLITYPFTDLNLFVDISYVNSKGGLDKRKRH